MLGKGHRCTVVAEGFVARLGMSNDEKFYIAPDLVVKKP